MQEYNQNILANTKILNGKKDFGVYKDIVERGAFTRVFEGDAAASSLVINISVFERYERLFVTLKHLFDSVRFSQEPLELILTDNSYSRRLDRMLNIFLKKHKSCFSKVVYHHDPTLIQSTARNRALQELSSKSEFFGQMDSDIYISPALISIALHFLRNHTEIAGCSTALAGYKEGAIRENFEYFGHLGSDKIKHQLMMPGLIGEQIGKWSQDKTFLQTTMIRGLMFFRRAVCEQINDGEPWSRHLTVWQNVGFNIELNERKQQIGHILDRDAIALHDDRYDPNSVSFLPNLPLETIKSVILICMRNQIERFRIHQRFEKFTSSSLQCLFKCSVSESQKLFAICSLIGEMVAECEDVEEAKKEYRRMIIASGFSNSINYHLLELPPILFQNQNNYAQVRKMNSKNILQSIYSISNPINF